MHTVIGMHWVSSEAFYDTQSVFNRQHRLSRDTPGSDKEYARVVAECSRSFSLFSFTHEEYSS